MQMNRETFQYICLEVAPFMEKKSHKNDKCYPNWNKC
jgi:hypothetical protein